MRGYGERTRRSLPKPATDATSWKVRRRKIGDRRPFQRRTSIREHPSGQPACCAGMTRSIWPARLGLPTADERRNRLGDLEAAGPARHVCRADTPGVMDGNPVNCGTAHCAATYSTTAAMFRCAVILRRGAAKPRAGFRHSRKAPTKPEPWCGLFRPPQKLRIVTRSTFSVCFEHFATDAASAKARQYRRLRTGDATCAVWRT